MSDHSNLSHATGSVLDRTEVEGVLSTNFYSNRPTPAPQNDAARRADRPTHYKVICISMYTEDLQRLDAMVDTLKGRGMTKANRSALIRYALGEVDLESVPRGL